MVSKEELREAKEVYVVDEQFVSKEFIVAVGDKWLFTVYSEDEKENDLSSPCIYSVSDNNIFLTLDEAVKEFGKTHTGKLYEVCPGEWLGEDYLEPGDIERALSIIEI